MGRLKENHKPQPFATYLELGDKRTIAAESRDEEAPSLYSHYPRRPLRQLDSASLASGSSPLQSIFVTEEQEQQKPVRRALLRYGEQFETLFGIAGRQEDLSPSYIQDCHNLADNEDDQLIVWRRVLDYASQNQILSASDLVRLHRRATTRLPASSECTSDKELDHLLAIWISYVNAQMRQGSEKEARLTLQHIRRWASQKATFVLQMAKMEEQTSIQKAISIIQDGIDHKAQPILELQQYLANLQSIDNPASARKRKKADQPLSPKRLKTDNGRVDVPAVLEFKQQGGSPLNPATRKDPIRFKLGPLPRRNNNISQVVQDDGARAAVDERATNEKGVMVEERKPPVNVTQHSIDIPDFSSRHMNTPNAPKQSSARSGLGPSASKMTAPLLSESTSKTPATASGEEAKGGGRLRFSGSSIRRLPSKLGKARRVDAVLGNEHEDDDDDEEDDAEEGEHSKVAPVADLDLSYILEWEPKHAPPRQSQEAPKAKPSPRLLPKIEEARPVAVAAKKSTSIEEKEDSSSHQHKQTAWRNDISGPERQTSEGRLSGSSSQRSKEKYNEDFLPLLEEKNIIRVNGAPFVKLGAPIGKGGSCKVYRALARDNSVVAIKKVKLAGMDKKAVESYANEIRLLKSLRGCSTIIQMYDSEVDLQRKAIFVVMELGEADLNHILQKQTFSHSAEGGRYLNMNFIRLTWQQMLSAVHCIHEARIIHGDLKPANFLFVKGTLKLIDFGIAKAIENQDTTNIYRESQIGTLNYMSPEAILDSGIGGDKPTMKIGRASDIWSLGCILYQMLYGKTPFADLHMIQKLQAIVNPNYEIRYPETVDALAIDVMKQCLQRRNDLRPPIVGGNGLLNEHPFLVTRMDKNRNASEGG